MVGRRRNRGGPSQQDAWVGDAEMEDESQDGTYSPSSSKPAGHRCQLEGSR